MSEIKPIRSEADYEAALAEVERLWGARSGTPEGDRLDVLTTLIDGYESEHHAIDPPDPIEVIKFRIEQQSLTRKDLEGILGSRTRIAEVLNRRRSLSINMIRRLHDKLGISAEVLIRPSRMRQGLEREFCASSISAVDKNGETVEEDPQFRNEDKMRAIKISDAVWAAIAERGKFGESEDDVLRRVFALPADNVTRHAGPGRTGRGGKRNATKRMSAGVTSERLLIEFEGVAPRPFVLPHDLSDKAAIKRVRADAHNYARTQGATQGQIDAITKALNEAGYYTQRRRLGVEDIPL
jgi:HTH-type transcriptional regulator / antitoxin HigA